MDSMSESSRLLKETEADKRQKSAFLVKSDMSRLKAPVVNNDEIETLYWQEISKPLVKPVQGDPYGFNKKCF